MKATPATTADTPQDTDGTPLQIMRERYLLAVEHLDMLRQVAPLDVVPIEGNHDRAAAHAMLLFLTRGSARPAMSWPGAPRSRPV